MTETTDKGKKKQEPYWLVYVSAFLSGLVLLTDAIQYAPMQKVSARLGIALVFSAFALIVGRNNTPSVIAAALIWAAVIMTFVL